MQLLSENNRSDIIIARKVSEENMQKCDWIWGNMHNLHIDFEYLSIYKNYSEWYTELKLSGYSYVLRGMVVLQSLKV